MTCSLRLDKTIKHFRNDCPKLPLADLNVRCTLSWLRAPCNYSEMINHLWAGPSTALIKDLIVDCLFQVILFHYT